jgi:benzoate membrane transport protein
MSLLGLGAAFWSLVLGMAVHVLMRRHRARAAPSGTVPRNIATTQETPMHSLDVRTSERGQTP